MPKPRKRTAAEDLQTIQNVNKSVTAGHKMIRDNPPKVSVRAWLKSKLTPRAEQQRQKKVRDALGSRSASRKPRRSSGRGGGR